MLDAAFGPFLFDTSADPWFARHASPIAGQWMRHYAARHRVHVSAITVFERVRGFAVLLRRSPLDSRPGIEHAWQEYLADPGEVHPVDTKIAAIAAEICALIPDPPSPPKRAHRLAESRQDDWRAGVTTQ